LRSAFYSLPLFASPPVAACNPDLGAGLIMSLQNL
jgi:hypothetical protein